MSLTSVNKPWMLMSILSFITGAYFIGIFSSADRAAEYSLMKYALPMFFGLIGFLLSLMQSDVKQLSKIKIIVVIMVLLSQVPLIINCFVNNEVPLKIHDNYLKPDNFFTFYWYQSLPNIIVICLSSYILVRYYSKKNVKIG